MRGHTQKATEPKTPKESLNSSTIQKYLTTKEVNPKSPGLEKETAGGKREKERVGKTKRGPRRYWNGKGTRFKQYGGTEEYSTNAN